MIDFEKKKKKKKQKQNKIKKKKKTKTKREKEKSKLSKTELIIFSKQVIDYVEFRLYSNYSTYCLFLNYNCESYDLNIDM